MRKNLEEGGFLSAHTNTLWLWEKQRQVCGFWNQATFMLLPGSASWGSKTREKNGYLLGAGWWDLRKPHNHSLWPQSTREAAAHAQSWEATWAGKMHVAVGTYRKYMIHEQKCLLSVSLVLCMVSEQYDNSGFGRRESQRMTDIEFPASQRDGH